MTTFPADEHLPGEWHAGYDEARCQRAHPAPAEPFKFFCEEDEARFWMLAGEVCILERA